MCGHPTGDCTSDKPDPKHIVGLEFMKKIPPSEKTVLVLEDIWEEVWITPPTSFTNGTKTKRLVAAKGSYVTPEVARECGIME